MRRISACVASAVLALTLAWGTTSVASAVDATVSLRVGDPYTGPQLEIQTSPMVTVIPGTRVYYIEDSSYPLYRFGKNWYYYYDGGWYRAKDPSGPYAFIGYRSIPGPIRKLPEQYRRGWVEVRGPAYGTFRNGRWYRATTTIKSETKVKTGY